MATSQPVDRWWWWWRWWCWVHWDWTGTVRAHLPIWTENTGKREKKVDWCINKSFNILNLTFLKHFSLYSLFFDSLWIGKKYTITSNLYTISLLIKIFKVYFVQMVFTGESGCFPAGRHFFLHVCKWTSHHKDWRSTPFSPTVLRFLETTRIWCNTCSEPERTDCTCGWARKVWTLAHSRLRCAFCLVEQVWSKGGSSLQGREQGLVQAGWEQPLVGTGAKLWKRAEREKQNINEQIKHKNREDSFGKWVFTITKPGEHRMETTFMTHPCSDLQLQLEVWCNKAIKYNKLLKIRKWYLI